MSATIIPFAGFFTGRAGIHKQSKRNAPVAWARLTLLFLLGLPSPTIAQTGQYGDFTWSQSWTNITITGYTGSGGAVTIPDKINNLPVTSIGTGAFIICFGLTSVTIPNGVANIGDRAFYYCTNLASVTIPNSVTNIGSKAFYACSSLYAVTMTNSVVSIGDEAFSYSGLSTVKIPISVTNIGINPFAFCSHLIRLTVDSNNPAYASPSGVLFDKSMTTLIAYPPARYPPMDFTTAKSFEVSNGVVRICIEAFYGCSRLTNIAISPTVTNIGANPFAGCSGLIGFTVDSGNPAYCSVDGVLFDKSQSTLIAYTPSASATSYAAPDSVARIEEMAFYTSAKLASVIIPNGVSSIERSVFQGCPSLTNVVIGNGVASIGTNAFASCSNLPSIAIPNSVASIRSFAFGNCSKLTNVVIGNSVTNIESSAFDHCVKLASVVFKGNAPAVQTDTSVFNGDTTATIYYSAGMQGWWGSLFDGRPTALGFPYIYTNNSGAITITGYTDTGNAAVIPNQIDGLPVVGIASNAFTNCSLLPSVTIPASVASICANPFAQCSRATAITVDPGNSSYASVAGVLFDKNLTTLIAYPAARASFYAIPNTVVNIGDSAFYGSAYLRGVTIPDSVASIGNCAFESCYLLTNLSFPNSVTNIGSYAFAGCWDLTNVIFGNSLASIGDSAFQSCWFLTSANLPNSVASIGTKAFAYCEGLTNIVIGNRVGSISDNAFNDCRSLTSVTIPNSVTNIGIGAFAFCYRLTNAVIGNSVARFGTNAFSYSTNLTGVYFKGNAPGAGLDATVFAKDTKATVYYLDGTTGWSTTFDGVLTAVWTLPVPTLSAQYVASNVVLTWSSGVLLESTNLEEGVWTTNASAQSPCDIAPGGPRKFYRVLSN